MLRKKLQEIITDILPTLAKKYGKEIPADLSFQIEKPKDAQHGDFATDVAFKLSKVFKRSPWDIVQDMCGEVKSALAEDTKHTQCISDVSVARPGFLNITMYNNTWGNVLCHIKEHEETFGASSIGAGERVILEYVSANPTGPLTIAHGRQACVGDALANILKKAGYEVYREYYLNDGGRQIKLLGESTQARYQEALNNTCVFPEEGYQGEYIRDIARMIIDEKGETLKDTDSGEALSFFSHYAMDYLMKGIKKDLHDIGVHFDLFFSEQSLQGDKIDHILKLLKKKKCLQEKDGALWFLSTQFGDDKDRVLRKSDGTFTYVVPDIAYHRDKFERGFTRVIDLLGPDHHGYIKRLKAGAAALGYDPEALTILIVQLTTLYKNGEPLRMSTRAGEFISLRQLIDEVGADATRFFFLMRKIQSHLDFDLELAKEKSQDNPVFYLQYAHARIANIITYSEKKVTKSVDLSLLKESDEFELIKLLHEFPYQIAQTARALEPYRLADYLKDVAVLFHRFYAHHRVVTDDEELTNARLLLCDAVRIVLRNGLEILGVSHPDEM
ncbi:MAG: arginine--tRNA ligase [Candidatus Omnitrophica bacterium]|nr:arginine--tRNA ligase [Candidatus Omnitrophota bacterium]